MGVRERERIAARLGEFVLWMHIFLFLHIDYSIDSYWFIGFIIFLVTYLFLITYAKKRYHQHAFRLAQNKNQHVLYLHILCVKERECVSVYVGWCCVYFVCVVHVDLLILSRENKRKKKISPRCVPLVATGSRIKNKMHCVFAFLCKRECVWRGVGVGGYVLCFCVCRVMSIYLFWLVEKPKNHITNMHCVFALCVWNRGRERVCVCVRGCVVCLCVFFMLIDFFWLAKTKPKKK